MPAPAPPAEDPHAPAAAAAAIEFTPDDPMLLLLGLVLVLAAAAAAAASSSPPPHSVLYLELEEGRRAVVEEDATCDAASVSVTAGGLGGLLVVGDWTGGGEVELACVRSVTVRFYTFK